MNNRKYQNARYIFSFMVPSTVLAFILAFVTLNDIPSFKLELPGVFDYVKSCVNHSR